MKVAELVQGDLLFQDGLLHGGAESVAEDASLSGGDIGPG